MSVETLPPIAERFSALRWLRENLFKTWLDAFLTIAGAWLIYVALKAFINWAFNVAEWRVIAVNLRLLLIGQYPIEEVGRLWIGLAFFAFLIGNSIQLWGSGSKLGLAALALPALLAVVPFESSARLWLLALSGLGFAGWGLARVRSEALRGLVIFGWSIALPVFILLTRGWTEEGGVAPVIGTNLWGGLLLTFLLTAVAIIFSFPIGILLALGRQARLPVVRLASTAYIELVRGSPLIAILFMAQLMLPLFLPANWSIDRVVRAMVGMTLFSAAYLAENVRGGLQAIPKGQYEAAYALGLSATQTTIFIILPQALRLVIPILVGQFIAVFKDTALVAIVGLFDLLGIAKTVLAQPEFLGLQREVYVFISLIYWAFSYVMAYLSRRLEERLGVGKR
ncbi:MAG: amino acid ABC transporter permease [Anaerolineales bacterium]